MTQKTNKRLTKKQLQLIDALAQGLDLCDVPTQCNISPATFHKWVTSEAFERELRFRQNTAQRQSELLLGRNASKAARKLIELMEEKDKPDVTRKACLDILSLTGKQTPTTAAKPSESSTESLDKEVAAKILELLSKNNVRL